MTGVAHRIMRWLQGKGKRKWGCAPSDFLDLGSAASFRQSLTRLSRTEKVRRVVRALDWLAPLASRDPMIVPTPRSVLPDHVKADLVSSCGSSPKWAVPNARSVVAQQQRQWKGRDHAH